MQRKIFSSIIKSKAVISSDARTPAPAWIAAHPAPSFRAKQADALSFHFAPAKWSACVARNLSSYFQRRKLSEEFN